MELWNYLPVMLGPLLLITFMLTSAWGAKTFPGKLSTYTLTAFGLAWLAALVTFFMVTFNGTINFSLLAVQINSAEVSLFGFMADRLSMLILLLVITVSGVVHLYSIRAMQEERKFGRYFTLLSLVTIEVLLVVLSNNLLMLAVFWIAKGFTLTFLLSHYDHRKASWHAAFKKLRIDLIGAGAFVLALTLTWKIFGTFNLQTINDIATQAPENLPGPQVALLTALLLVAAMAKSAQFPLHGWLPESVEAPTPVSALMHAGLINAGGFLIIRLSPLFVAAQFTMTLAIIVGGFTAFYGTLIMLTRTDVKGQLVYSTMGQMGFMILECGLGAFGLAILHIVAHGLFKATLFLSSGSVIQQKTTNQHLAPTGHERTSAMRLLAVSVVAALVLLLVPPALGFSLTTGSVLLIFAWFTVTYALPVLQRMSLAILLPGVVGLLALYIIVTHGIEIFFKPVIAAAPALDISVMIAIWAGLVVIGMATILLQTSNRPEWINQLFTRLYVQAMFTGYGK